MKVDESKSTVGCLNDLQEPLREAAGKYYEMPLSSKEALVSAVNTYADVIADAARRRGDLDINLADCIARCCLVLLAEHWDAASEHERRLVQCACHYFVDDEDEEGDLQSVYGFDDDAELVNVIVEQLGRPDLAIQV